MRRTPYIAVLTFAAAACATPPVGGQTGLDGSAVQPNIYTVAPEQVAAQEAGFIEVTGTGDATVEPDRASISLAMETRADNAADAAAANATAMDRVLTALRSGGFPGLELATHGYALRPEYDPQNRQTRQIRAYTVLNNIRATISDVSQVGRMIDVAVTAGANRVASIAFSASDTEAARSEALAQAVEHARSQAEVIAASLGHRLGAPLEVRGGAQRIPPVMAREMAFAAAQAAPTPIEAGDQTVTASVTIRFALGPELGP